VYLRHRWKNLPVKFGAQQVGKVLSNGETNRPGKNYWKGLLESLVYSLYSKLQSLKYVTFCDRLKDELLKIVNCLSIKDKSHKISYLSESLKILPSQVPVGKSRKIKVGKKILKNNNLLLTEREGCNKEC